MLWVRLLLWVFDGMERKSGTDEDFKHDERWGENTMLCVPIYRYRTF